MDDHEDNQRVVNQRRFHMHTELQSTIKRIITRIRTVKELKNIKKLIFIR